MIVTTLSQGRMVPADAVDQAVDGALSEVEQEALTYIDSLYRTALRLTGHHADAEDLVQETYFRAFRFQHQYQPGTNLRA